MSESGDDVRTEHITLHGHAVTFRHGGRGRVVLFVHGIAGSSATFDPVLPSLAHHCRVLAPDLLGHGRSAKPRGDYSLGTYAAGLRDLLEVLDIHAATIVGHSMGGGIAMQFAYQFPERCERLVLVDSGGLGPEVTFLLRAATLPGSDLVLLMATSDRVKRFFASALAPFGRMGISATPSLLHVADHIAALKDPGARRAFILTARSVLDLKGQRIDARDRLYLVEQLPTMIVWGGRDRLIPVVHGYGAHELIPGSRLEIFEQAGHFPHQDDPARFVDVLLDFLATTEPAHVSSALRGAGIFANPES